jgi:transposase
LLSTREQLVQQKTALTNALKAHKIKVVQTPLANEIYAENLARFNVQIKLIENEIQKKIDQHPNFRKTVSHLKSIPGIGLLLSANFLVATDGFENDLALKYRKASAFIGICPYEHTSGSSVYRRPRTPKYGPSKLRKLIHLAARSVVTHKAGFREYYVQKQLQGKAKTLILNNVANKLLKIMCAIVRTQRAYHEKHISVHPKNVLINT